MSRDFCVALPYDATGLSAVCNWYFLIILTYFFNQRIKKVKRNELFPHWYRVPGVVLDCIDS